MVDQKNNSVDMGRAGHGEASRRGAAPAAPAAHSLETIGNTVTWVEDEFVGYELSKCRCGCWFCPSCCWIKGLQLRQRLIPILETFHGLLLVTFTVDPTLFDCPRAAYLYMVDRRCIGRTIQDLRRADVLHSSRYFYVLEWQKKTEQVHFHVLLDALFIPFDLLLSSWSKHRPDNAGPVVGDRPAFGTAFISKRHFTGGALHAARYVTKYLIKIPRHGFPEWVLAMGDDRRVRRYSTSRGFWGGCTGRARVKKSRKSKLHPVPYSKRIAACGSSINVWAVSDRINHYNGEVTKVRAWVGQLNAPGYVANRFSDIRWGTINQALADVESSMPEPVIWLRQSRFLRVQ